MRMPLIVLSIHCLLMSGYATVQAADLTNGSTTITSDGNSVYHDGLGAPHDEVGEIAGHATIDPAMGKNNSVSVTHKQLRADGQEVTAAPNIVPAENKSSAPESGKPSKQKPTRDMRYAGQSIAQSGRQKGFSASMEKGMASHVNAETTKAQHARNVVIHEGSPELKAREEKRQKRKEAFKALLEKSEKRKRSLEKARQKSEAAPQ
jgi:hypothetical protein